MACQGSSPEGLGPLYEKSVRFKCALVSAAASVDAAEVAVNENDPDSTPEGCREGQEILLLGRNVCRRFPRQRRHKDRKLLTHPSDG